MSLPGLFDMVSSHFGDRVRENEPMSRHTTFRVGGPADLWALPKNTTEVALLVRLGREAGMPVTVIGGGSNVLVSDAGIRGLVIHMGAQIAGVKMPSPDRPDTVTLEAGHSLPALCRLYRDQGWSGLHFAVGIPGSIGGAIRMNAGTRDGCISDVLHSITGVNALGEIVHVEKNRIQGKYRQLSISADTEDVKAIITEATLMITPGNTAVLSADAEERWQSRRSTQPGLPSAGCTFKNPSQEMPAGKLIEEAGLKGFSCGGAEISTKHANFIVNKGNATADDILTLIQKSRSAVRDKFDIDLELEIKVFGA